MAPIADLPQGWLTMDEAEVLSTLAAGKVVLELGAYKGRSTVVLAQVADYVVSVDRHRGIEPDHAGDTVDDYLSATRGLENVAKVICEDWHPFVAVLAPVFDLVYIDGDHDYAAVYRDAVLAKQLKPAVVAFHDFDFDDVVTAANEVLGNPTNRVGSLAWYKR